MQQGIPKPLTTQDTLSLGTNEQITARISENIVHDSGANNTYTTISSLLANASSIFIGRDPSCDIQLHGDFISRKHASVKKINDKYYIKDENSKNGTFLNGKSISGEKELSEGDIILIGTHKLSLGSVPKDIRQEVAIQLINLEKRFPQNDAGLKLLNLEIKSKSLVGIMGPSGCGKSTLLKAITGHTPASSGSILIHGLDLTTHYEYIKTNIGYVPQEDTIHSDLTVYQCLLFSCHLRSENTNKVFVNEQIDKVLNQLGIFENKFQLISSLSGGQRKRVSIAVEMLNNPLVLFLDEPTSPLDPQSVEDFLTILKTLALAGTTVVLVTHKPEDLAFLDEVLFLGKNGYPLFYDKVHKHKSFFGVDKTVQVYPLISNERDIKFKEYHQRFLQDHPASPLSTFSQEKLSTKKEFGFFNQLYWLTKRYGRIKLNDSVNSAIMLLQAPIIAVLIIMIFNVIDQGMLFLFSISAIWFGTNNAAREIVSESAIYKRERMYNLGILPYIGSKLIILSLFALVQSVLFISIVSFYFEDKTIAINNFALSCLWFWILSVASLLFGLFISAAAKTSNQVVSIVPIVLIPQIMLAGVLAKILNFPVEVLSWFTLSRWGTEGFANVQQHIRTTTFDPQNPGQTMRVTSDARTQILTQFHSNYSDNSIFGTYTATLRLDLLAVGVLALLFFSLLIYFMKKKDSL